MKKTYLCGCAMFRSLCQFVLNRRKWLQDKKRLRVLRRLDRLLMVTK